MYFSEYVLVDKQGGYLDPLGFMRPAGALQAGLFKQFTVLSNHPGYHGVLCALWNYLQKKGHTPQQATFSRRFREVEIFWGLLNATRNVGVLNVRKYKRLCDAQEFSLQKLPRQHSLFVHLAYGTLGHYTQPSIVWGLLAQGGKALTEDGVRLGEALNLRPGRPTLEQWLERWCGGPSIGLEECEALSEQLNLLAAPSGAERQVWTDRIAHWVDANPKTRPLWKDPVPQEELEAAQENPASYAAHYGQLVERYPTLQADVEAMQDFERLAGAVQFVFDRKLARLQYAADGLRSEPAVLKKLPNAMVRLAARAAERGSAFEPGRLYSTLAEIRAPTLGDVEEAICQHHHAHQRRKGVTPFLEASGLLVQNTVDKPGFGDILEKLHADDSVEACMDRLQYHSRRDWHFRRCRLYADWASGDVPV